MLTLVTGATGFLGTSLVRQLLSADAQVRVLARSPQSAKPLVDSGAELVSGEITDADALRRAIKGVSVVFHLAGKLFIPGTPDSVYRATHVEGTRLIVAACRQQGQITRFVHCSTTGVLGATGSLAANESAAMSPTNAYEATKGEAETLMRNAIESGFPAVIVRPGLVYGPGDLHLLGFFRSIQRRHFRPIGRGPVWLHPIYIDDMTAAFLRCAEHRQAIGEIFHIAGRKPVTIEHLAASIAGALEIDPPRGRIPMPVARAAATVGDLLPPGLKRLAPLTRSRLDFLTHSRVYDVSKATQLIDFSANTDLDAGIECSVAWYRQLGYLPRA